MAVDGALIVDKPSGPTSHDVVSVARRALHTRQIGHAGTLDPLATGVLVLLVGRATRLSQFIVHDDKEYFAHIRLGIATATYDAEGLSENSQRPTSNSQIDQFGGWTLGVGSLEKVLSGFRGTFLQSPPPFSAKKIGGRRAYEHARKDRAIEMKPVQVTVRELEALPSDDPTLLRLRMVVGAGFYVRSLAHDIGRSLGCGAHLEALRRTRSGPFGVEDSISLEALATETPPLLPLDRLVQQLPGATLSIEGSGLVSHGNAIGARHVTGAMPTESAGAFVRLLGADGSLVAIGRQGTDGLLHPQVVLV